MTFSSAYKKLFYYVVLTLSVSTIIYFIFNNVDEVINRSRGGYTIFSQMSWLSDRQAIFYCCFLIIIYLIFLVLIVRTLYQKMKKRTILISLLSLTFSVALIFFETLLYNKPV